MQLRYPSLAAVLVGFLLPSLAIAGERYRGLGMMSRAACFHMFFGFLLMILFLEHAMGRLAEAFGQTGLPWGACHR